MRTHMEAAIIDLDGVITKTAAQHAKAWKLMFDQYNEQRGKAGKESFDAFQIENDYPKYIDGIPRYDGVRNFLKSRNITLAEGSKDDAPGTETIGGLGNLKNQLFMELIEREGVEVYMKNIEQIKVWKTNGIKTAVISSSENCKRMLELTGTEDLFDVRVDGEVSKERGIKGKPEPDIFLEAAKALNIDPAHALVVEDSLAGVEAGKRGQFGFVVGIKNNASKEELIKKGADEVVDSLDQLTLLNLPDAVRRDAKELPSALKEWKSIKQKIKRHKPCLFLDYDGTLTPIVERYEDAVLSDEMKASLESLSKKYLIAVVSGRGLDDIKERVGLKDIHYAGSHGFEISGPDHFHKENDEAKQSIPALDEIESELKNKLGLIEGARIERKRYAMAVHYRQVAEEFQPDVIEIVEEVASEYDKVKTGPGKKVIEIKPNVDWDKGKAVAMLLQELIAKEGDLYPIYIGDDITDEDAFRDLQNGTGILVGDHGEPTLADYYLEDVDEVKQFFEKIMEDMED